MQNLIPKTLIVFTVLYLESFLNFVNMSMLVYFPIAAGISLNLKDILILGFLVYFVFSEKKDRVSPQLKLLLIYLGFCLFAVTLMSLIAYGATLDAIGRRLSNYFSYVLILGLVMLVDGEKNLKFFFGMIFVIGLLACCIHFVEYARGSMFYIPGGGVTGRHFTEVTSMYEGVSRFWNRASSTTMIMFLLSAVFLATNMKNRMVFVVPFVFALASIALSMVRTLYVFVVFTLITVFIVSLVRKEGRPVFFGALLIIIGVVGPLYILEKNPEMFAIVERFNTIISIYTDGVKGTTMGARQQQIEFFKRKMVEADIPPAIGIGITNETAKYVSSDLGYMNIIVNMGLLGIVFIIFVFIYLFHKARFLMNKARDDLGKSIGVAIFCMLPGLLIIGWNFDYLTYTHFPKLLFPVVLLEAASYMVRRDQVAVD